MAHYKDFPVVVSSRWQQEVTETVWNVVNSDRDRDDERLNEKHSKAHCYAQGKDIIVWGPCYRLGGPFQSQWQRWVYYPNWSFWVNFGWMRVTFSFRKHLYLFPNRLEIGIDSDPHVWPLEEIIGIQENVHRSYRCIQIRLVKDHKRLPNYSPVIGILVYRYIFKFWIFWILVIESKWAR